MIVQGMLRRVAPLSARAATMTTRAVLQSPLVRALTTTSTAASGSSDDTTTTIDRTAHATPIATTTTTTTTAAAAAHDTLSSQMREKGFVHSTPNFSPDFTDVSAAVEQATSDVTTSPALDVDVVRDMHGPWLVMTDDLQGELYVDHDRFVYYRPAHGLGYGIGTLQLYSAGATGTAFTLRLESYAYAATSTFVPLRPRVLDVTGIVQRVTAPSSQYSTLAMNGVWCRLGGDDDIAGSDNNNSDDSNSDDNKKDTTAAAAAAGEQTDAATSHTTGADGDKATTGQFNCAKITPWDVRAQPTWQPSTELQTALQATFPDALQLDSHVRRAAAAAAAAAAKDAAACTAAGGGSVQHVDDGNSSNDDGGGGVATPHHVQLAPYAVGAVPGVYYIPDYISADEERQMLDQIARTPRELKSKLTKRTAQEWGCAMCDVCKQSFVHEANMPPWVQQYTDMLLYDGIFTPSTFPNSVRIHEYDTGEGIGPHCDGPIYVPLVTVLSMASTCVMRFYPRREPYHRRPMDHYNDTFVFADGAIGSQRPLQSVVLEPRSMLVFAGEAYYYYPHGVLDNAVDSLAPDVAGEVVNRAFLHDKDVREVARRYRVSITTRNLLPRCNDAPARTEYGMKRAWYVYTQQPLPHPLFTPSPLLLQSPQPQEQQQQATTTTTAQAATTAHSALATDNNNNNNNNNNAYSSSPAVEASGGSGGAAMRGPRTRAQQRRWEQRLDAVLSQQAELRRSVDELRHTMTAFMASEQSYRKETSVLLNTLSTSVLDVDAKLEDVLDALPHSPRAPQ